MSTTPQEEPQEMPETPPMPPLQSEDGSITKAMQSIKQAPDVVKGHVPEAVKHPKESLLGSIHGAQEAVKNGLVGSKSIPAEWNKLKGSYSDFYKTSIGSTLRATKKLVTLHPVQAVKEFVGGTTGNLANMANIITSPSRFAVAGSAKVVNTAGTVAKLPFKAVKGIANSPFKIWNTLNTGTNKLFGIGSKIKAWNGKGF